MSINSGAPIPGLKNRFLLFSLAATAIFLLLICRLWYLQIIQTDRFALLSEKNRIRYVPIAASRGPIFDRDGVLLVDSRPSFDVSVMRQDVKDHDLLLDRLAYYLDADVTELRSRWDAGRRFPVYRPIVLAEDVDRETMDRVEENSTELPGVITRVRPIRAYPYHDLAAHLFGYLGEISEKDLRGLGKMGYRGGDLLGKSGIEALLESNLRGSEGQQRLEVDVKGKELRQVRVHEPVPGKRVFLTLQHDLQRTAEEAFGDQAGAAVALDVRTGEVLAMVSRPAYDPSLFARGISGPEWLELLQDSRHPLQNKAIKGQYPPGSTFKVLVALAALEAGVVSPDTTFNCNRRFSYGDSVFRCWKKGGHGKTDLEKALRESCDIWFYQVGLELGIDRLSKMAGEMGLGVPTGFALRGEKGGLIPDRQWKKKHFGTSWYHGETVIAAIGQGYVQTTPMQLAVMTAAIANGGTILRPQMIGKIEDWEGAVLQEFAPETVSTVELDPANLATVRKAMEEVVSGPHGTGYNARMEEVRVAGKTGTSQVIRLKDDEELEEDEEDDKEPYRFRDHALFIAYAPVEAPEIAIAVVVEHGEGGSTAAAPIAREMLESYFGADSRYPKFPPSRETD